MGMELRLIEKKGEPVRTEFKIPQKDFLLDKRIRRLFEGKHPYRQSSRYVYYRLDGDYLNRG